MNGKLLIIYVNRRESGSRVGVRVCLGNKIWELMLNKVRKKTVSEDGTLADGGLLVDIHRVVLLVGLHPVHV